jgi:hypothetical protein
VAAFTYDLPGKSARFQKAAARLLGGWSLEGIFTAQTGVPYTPLIGEDIAGNGDQFAANNQRPNLVPASRSTSLPRRRRSVSPIRRRSLSRRQAPTAMPDVTSCEHSGLNQLDLGLHKT